MFGWIWVGGGLTALAVWGLLMGQEALRRKNGGDGWAQLESLVMDRWLVWAGGAALVLAAGFLIKYGVDEGWLQVSPAQRIAGGAVFGGLLYAWGAWSGAQRGDPTAPLPATAAGAGLAILFASLYAGHGLYALFDHRVALLGLMGLIGLGALGALRHGEAVAAIGLVGAQLAPLVIDRYGMLFLSAPEATQIYEALITLGALWLQTRRAWWGFAGLSLLGWLCWAGAAALSSQKGLGIQGPPLLSLIGFFAAAALGQAPNRWTAPVAAAIAPALLALGLSHPWASPGALVLAAGAALIVARATQTRRWLGAAAAPALMVWALLVWEALLGPALIGGGVFGGARAWRASLTDIPLLASLAAVYGGAGALCAWGATRRGDWAVLAGVGGLGLWLTARLIHPAALPALVWSGGAFGLAALHLALTGLMGRGAATQDDATQDDATQDDATAGRSGFLLSGAAALAAAALLAQQSPGLLTGLLSALIPAPVWAATRLGRPRLALGAFALLALATVEAMRALSLTPPAFPLAAALLAAPILGAWAAAWVARRDPAIDRRWADALGLAAVAPASFASYPALLEALSTPRERVETPAEGGEPWSNALLWGVAASCLGLFIGPSLGLPLPIAAAALGLSVIGVACQLWRRPTASAYALLSYALLILALVSFHHGQPGVSLELTTRYGLGAALLYLGIVLARICVAPPLPPAAALAWAGVDAAPVVLACGTLALTQAIGPDWVWGAVFFALAAIPGAILLRARLSAAPTYPQEAFFLFWCAMLGAIGFSPLGDWRIAAFAGLALLSLALTRGAAMWGAFSALWIGAFWWFGALALGQLFSPFHHPSPEPINIAATLIAAGVAGVVWRWTVPQETGAADAQLVDITSPSLQGAALTLWWLGLSVHLLSARWSPILDGPGGADPHLPGLLAGSAALLLSTAFVRRQASLSILLAAAGLYLSWELGQMLWALRQGFAGAGRGLGVATAVTVSFAAPSLAALGVGLGLRAGGLALAARWSAVGLGCLWAMAEIHFRLGAPAAAPWLTQAELYAFSGLGLGLGLVLWNGVALGLGTPSRKLALAVIVLTTAKVFVVDLAWTQGLGRALSFFGLGAALLAFGAARRAFGRRAYSGEL